MSLLHYSNFYHEPSNPLTLITVGYQPEIVGGGDADGVSQRAGAEFSGYSAIPGQSSDIYQVETATLEPYKNKGEHKSGP